VRAIHSGVSDRLGELDTEFSGGGAGQASAPQHPARAARGCVDQPVKLRRIEGHRLSGTAGPPEDGGAQTRL
jgi:hypothetical protein